MKTTISTQINLDNWDEEIINVLHFLYNRVEFDGFRGLYLAANFDAKTVEEAKQLVEDEMWKRVRFFQYHGYQLEPPEQVEDEELRRLTNIINRIYSR